LTALGSRDRDGGFIDTNQFGKPEKSDGMAAAWRYWSIVFQSFAIAMQPDFAQHLEIAKAATYVIVDDALPEEAKR